MFTSSMYYSQKHRSCKETFYIFLKDHRMITGLCTVIKREKYEQSNVESIRQRKHVLENT